MTSTRRFTLPFACLIALALALAFAGPGCGKKEKSGGGAKGGDTMGGGGGGSMSAAPGKADSPQAVFETFMAAIKKKDFHAAFSQVEPKNCRKMAIVMAMGPYIGLSMRLAMSRDPAAKAKAKAQIDKLTAFLKTIKIDLTQMKGMPRGGGGLDKLGAGIDGPKAVAAILAWMEKEAPGRGGAAAFKDGKLSGLEMAADGKSATASFTGGRAPGAKPVKFVKQDGRWYIIFEMRRKKGGGAVPAGAKTPQPAMPPTVNDRR